MAYCILRPNSFLQNLPAYYAPSIQAQGVFYGAMGDARISYLDVRDIAAVAARTLRDGRHDGKTYELNGPEALTCAEIADRISRHAGIPAKYADIPAEAQRKAMMDGGMAEWTVTAVLELQEYYTGGRGGAVDGVLEELLGRSSIDADRFLKEFAEEFRSHATNA
jgi:uncharacterized protein YbjT (DUF2867 family)